MSVMSECFLSGRGQGHVSNFYIVDLENFATASRRYTGDNTQLDRRRFVYDTLPPTKPPTRVTRSPVFYGRSRILDPFSRLPGGEAAARREEQISHILLVRLSRRLDDTVTRVNIV